MILPVAGCTQLSVYYCTATFTVARGLIIKQVEGEFFVLQEIRLDKLYCVGAEATCPFRNTENCLTSVIIEIISRQIR